MYKIILFKRNKMSMNLFVNHLLIMIVNSLSRRYYDIIFENICQNISNEKTFTVMLNVFNVEQKTKKKPIKSYCVNQML